jgi:GntR family transcriptional regulator, vanillate catabolism transcriptional regulator
MKKEANNQDATGAIASFGSESVHGNASAKALLRLRELIGSGELAGGARIAELSIVEKIGVSRTPIRAALMRLEQEGLLEALPNGGYAVRTFSERDISEAIELRGTLEGLCARLAAERGAPPVVMRDAHECLLGIDEILKSVALSDDDFTRYVTLNEKFHQLLVEMCGSSVIAKQLDRVMSLPFASPSSFVVAQANSPQVRDMFVVAQAQHWQVLQAIEQREGARAEAVMREHSRIAQTNLRGAVSGQSATRLPGVQLIRRR